MFLATEESWRNEMNSWSFLFFRMMASPESSPKIDWEYFKAHIPIQGMVDDFRKKYEALNIPYPSDNVTPQIEQQEREAVSN